MNEITDKIWCIHTFNGVEIWINDTQKNNLINLIEEGKDNILFEGRFLKSSSIEIYSAQDISDRNKLKRGMWQCIRSGKIVWHEKEKDCDCITPEEQERRRKFIEEQEKNAIERARIKQEEERKRAEEYNKLTPQQKEENARRFEEVFRSPRRIK